MDITKSMLEKAISATTFVGKHFYIDFRKVRVLGCYGITRVFYLCAWDDTGEVFVSDTLFVISNFDENGDVIIDHGFKDQ